MRNSPQPKIIETRFEVLKKSDLDEIRKTYKIVEVPYLDPIVVDTSTKNDIYFVIFSKKKELLNVPANNSNKFIFIISNNLKRFAAAIYQIVRKKSITYFFGQMWLYLLPISFQGSVSENAAVKFFN